ncbi:hypothetical protein DFH09DRAFT_1092618 [Mycena vulgaris]|nr:hypothetical protein DFH09DRAFT_1092618 [Mycena vulgaris]
MQFKIFPTDLRALSFDGAVEVAIRFNTDTTTVVLNTLELEIGTTSLALGDETLTPTNIEINADTQRVTLFFAEPFARGSEAVLRMTFRGSLHTFSGYFKSEWMNDGKVEYYSAMAVV